MSDKQEIRQTMRRRRKALTVEERSRAAAVINDKLMSASSPLAELDPLDGLGDVCAVYLASRDEIDLSPAIGMLLDVGVTVVAPRWNGETYELAKLKSLKEEDLREGPMGILEPKEGEIVPPKKVDVWLVPGLAFTPAGGRLGYGGGWYDRLMADANKYARKVGIAYAFQLVENLPNEPHDIRLNAVVDESLDHPLLTFTELPDGARIRVSIARRGRWWLAFFGGLVGTCLFPLVLWGGFRLERGHLPLGAGIALLVLGALAVLVGAIVLLYALGGPFEAELELRGEEGVCRRKWLGLFPGRTRRFARKPWTRFFGGSIAFYNAPSLALLEVEEGAKHRPLFRSLSKVTEFAAIRLNRLPPPEPEQVRVAREELLAHLPRGMSRTRNADGTALSVWSPSLREPLQYLGWGGFCFAWLAYLVSLLLDWSPGVGLGLLAVLVVGFGCGFVYQLVWGLFGRYRLTVRGEEGIYIKKLFAWERRRIFLVRSLVAKNGSLYAQAPDGSSFRLFDTVPLRCHLYIEQFVNQELRRFA